MLSVYVNWNGHHGNSRAFANLHHGKNYSHARGENCSANRLIFFRALHLLISFRFVRGLTIITTPHITVLRGVTFFYYKNH